MSEPLHIISLGAGVQSSTMALMAAFGEITPMPNAAIFADTQDEPASVYRWLDWLEPRLSNGLGAHSFPLYRVTAGSLSASALKMKFTKDGRRFTTTNIPFFAKAANGDKGKVKLRGCTRDFKLIPIKTKAAELVGILVLREWRKKWRTELRVWSAWKKLSAAAEAARKAGKPIPAVPAFPKAEWNAMQADCLAIQWIGISLDEMARMKPSRDPWLRSRWPLIEKEMSRHDCKRWMTAHNFPEPPRSACVYCPHHSNSEWRRLRDSEPAEFEKAVQFEKGVQREKLHSQNFNSTPFLHRSCVPLDQVDLSTDEDRGQGILAGFNAECEGMCGV
jgi:hypothetical protein